MNVLPQSEASLSSVEGRPCPQCAQENPPEETYCLACGAALCDGPADPLLSPLTVGTVLADLYVIETSEPHERENRYRAVRCHEAGSRVLLRERASQEAEPWRALAERTSGLTHPALLAPERLIEQDGRVYLVCPDIAGIRLAERIGLT